VVGRDDLTQLAPQHAGDVLRTVPSVNVVGEDPMGLRLNLSIRGLDPNRSRKVLVLEDGVPVSLNPYGSPELYYTPPIERMERVEVVRGSGQILWGPQTLGGVIHYVTREPPRRLTLHADLRYGSFGYLLAALSAGDTQGAVGWRLDVLHRRFEGPRALDAAVTDVNGQLRLQLSPRATLRLKLDFYDESSRATYLGLNTSQFVRDPTLSLAPHDRFDVRRYALTATHQHMASSSLLLRTSLYAYQTDRAWRRQEFDRVDAGVPYERVCDLTGRCGAPGDAGVMASGNGSSLFFRPSAAIRDRRFEVLGVEPRLTWTWSSGAVAGELIALTRIHYETALEQTRLTSAPEGGGGTPDDAERRAGFALAAAVQHRFTLWERLHLTPGLRVESFWSSRHILRATEVVMGQRVGRDVDIQGSSSTVALIPGLGVAFDATEALTVFAGFHRGYAPPRTRDAVSPAGANLQLDPELSWNTELGVRARVGRWLRAEVAGFHLEFENQILPPSEAGGGAGSSFSAGHSRHSGLEASATVDLAGAFGASAIALPLIVNYTWLPNAAFVGGLFDANRLPYAPEHMLSAQLRVTHRVGLSAQLGLTWVSSQFADRENTVFPSADGLVGEIPAYLTLDARVAYTLRRAGTTFYVSGRNLTDQVYIASRAPQGIQPAGFRQVFAGVEWTFSPP
jgi:Fe(3+) dicitrate transport protein